jgi:hypothetical protein
MAVTLPHLELFKVKRFQKAIHFSQDPEPIETESQ